MTEQLTRKQLREARQAGVAVPESPALPQVASEDDGQVTSVAVDVDMQREFQLSGPIASENYSRGPELTVQPRSGSSPQPDVNNEALSPDELLRKFRERIRSNYQDGSIPIPQARLSPRVETPAADSYAFDIDSIRERLRAAAEAARAQQLRTAPVGEQLLPEPHHEAEAVREISEFDIAGRKSASSATVEALRESFADLASDPVDAAELVGEGITEKLSRRALRRQQRSESTVAPFAPGGFEEPVTAETAQVEDPQDAEKPEPTLEQQPEPAFAVELEGSEFVGQNLMAEPSTQSIVLDVIPDAVTMPIGISDDGLTTGSINIIPEQSVSDVTGAIAGIKADESTLKDTVTGAISVIEPVSALAVIAERRHHAVLPMTSLRRGWWQPYAVAVGIFAMIGAAAYAVYLVLEVLNS